MEVKFMYISSKVADRIRLVAKMRNVTVKKMLKDINLGLYSIIALFISTKVIDVIFDGIYNTKEYRIGY